ncbi:MAG: class I SAM-dependent methyltransferase [Bdellovibrionales bacterium]|nr:class I SAM-dependent methyltransferase [Bdellovibrionales bacterium]
MNDSTTTAPLGSAVNDYAQTGSRYDEFRQPMGFRHLVDSCQSTAQRLGLDLGALQLLAAGCGTGNYEERMLGHWRESGSMIGGVHLVDLFDEMLVQARSKVEPFGVLRGVHQTDLVAEDVPVDDGSIHIATLVECIHHFDRGNKLHPRTEAVLSRLRKKIVTGGSLCIVSTTPTQSRKSRYYQWAGQHAGLDVAEDPGTLYAEQYPRLELVIALLEDAGFECRPVRRIFGPYIREDVYLDPERLLADGEFAVSFFKYARDRGLFDRFAEGFSALIQSGGMAEVIAESERWRKKIGTSYMLEAVAA